MNISLLFLTQFELYPLLLKKAEFLTECFHFFTFELYSSKGSLRNMIVIFLLKSRICYWEVGCTNGREKELNIKKDNNKA